MTTQRLLNMRFGLFRIVLAGAFALFVIGTIFTSQRPLDAEQRDDSSLAWVFFIIWAVLSVVAGMIFLVVVEALIPTGSLPRFLELRRELRGRVRRTRRYWQIVRIAVRHGLGPYLRGRRRPERGLARSLRLALDDAGVTFVKLGQVLSTRSDLLPPEVIAELSLLQDQVSVAGWDEIEAILSAELGPDAFAELDRTPIAAASVAQVYRARLHTGEDVVVKVQRPGIRTTVERDLDIVARLAARLERDTAWARAIGVRDLAAGFAQAIREELDFTVEAGNMTAIAGSDAVVVPRPHRALCTDRVVVMERLAGDSLTSATITRDRAELARTLLEFMLRQVLFDGVFHADPHPGNILLLADGRLGLLDFGSVGRLDGALRQAFQRFLLAVDHADPLAATDALLEIVYRPDALDEQRLERALGQFMARHLSAGARPGAAMFADLFRIVTEHGMSIPPEVAAVFRALGTLEGTIGQLAPDFDLVAEARQFAGQAAVSADPESVRRIAAEELASLLPMLRRLPRRLERITDAVERGRLGINVRLFADERDRRHVTGMLHQVLLTILGATAGLMAAVLLHTTGGPEIGESLTLFQAFGYSLLVVAVVLVLRILALIFRRE